MQVRFLPVCGSLCPFPFALIICSFADFSFLTLQRGRGGLLICAQPWGSGWGPPRPSKGPWGLVVQGGGREAQAHRRSCLGWGLFLVFPEVTAPPPVPPAEMRLPQGWGDCRAWKERRGWGSVLGRAGELWGSTEPVRAAEPRRPWSRVAGCSSSEQQHRGRGSHTSSSPVSPCLSPLLVSPLPTATPAADIFITVPSCLNK